MGAISSTTETDTESIVSNNILFSCKLIERCIELEIPLIYASSASVYGKKSGNCHELRDLHNFKPLNFYSKSKLIADEFLKENIKKKAPIIGLRYFNVYGLNEDHKLGMASPIHSFFKQLKSNGSCKIFGSFDGYRKGEHIRDFVSVNDCVSINIWAMKKK